MRARLAAAVAAAAMTTALAVAVPTSAHAVTDTTAPTATSVSVVSSTVGAGSPIAVRFTAVDDVAVSDVTGTITGPGGFTINLLGAGGSWPWQARTGGPIAGVVPAGAPPGAYTLTRLTVYDTSGNYTDYVDGAATSVPAGEPAVLDLSPATVTVKQPGTTDVTAPKLSTFSMLSSTDRRRGEFVTWKFAASDATTIAEVKVFVRKPSGTTVETHRGGGDLRAGRISLWIPTDEQTGTWSVSGVQLTDTSGNIRTYGRNGIGLQTGQPSHTASVFTGLGFSVATGALRPDSIRVFDDRPDPVVRTIGPSTPVAIGSTAGLRGTVTFLGSGVPYPVLALYKNVGGTRTFVRLVTGTATGAFSTPVPVTGTALYQLWFLGSDRAVALVPQLMGKPVRVSAGAKQTLTVASTTVTVPAGGTGVLSVTLSPKRGGATVVLRRWTGSAWIAVRSATTRADGKAYVTVSRPSSTTRYRWTTAYDGTGLAATSAVITVKR